MRFGAGDRVIASAGFSGAFVLGRLRCPSPARIDSSAQPRGVGLRGPKLTRIP